jgi:serine protease Do
MMATRFGRDVVAALMALGFSAPLAAPLGAQSGAAAGRVQRDSVVVRAFGPGMTDTIAKIFSALDREQYGSATWLAMTRKLDSLMSMTTGRLMFRTMAGAKSLSESMPRGWVGFNAQGPSQFTIDTTGYRITYFAYPSILSVDPESPAERAGIVPGDVLVALNGTDVMGHEFNLTRLFVPERKVALTIRHEGENKDLALDVVKAPEGVFNRRIEFNRMPRPSAPGLPTAVMRIEVDKSDRPGEPRHLLPSTVIGVPRGGAPTSPLMAGGFMLITPHGVLGANVSPVGADLARVLKLEKGMLLNEVPERSPAFKAGLRAGDVIVAALGQPVVTLNELQDAIVSRLGDRTIALQIVRDKKPVKLTVTW